MVRERQPKQGFYKEDALICTRIKIQKRIDKPTVQALGGNCPHFIFLFGIPYACTVQYSTGLLPPFFPVYCNGGCVGEGEGGRGKAYYKEDLLKYSFYTWPKT